MMMGIAVSVHMRPESIAGSSMATKPSWTGSLLRDAPCIIIAVPAPASLM